VAAHVELPESRRWRRSTKWRFPGGDAGTFVGAFIGGRVYRRNLGRVIRNHLLRVLSNQFDVMNKYCERGWEVR
jgi:hypothetical protein